MRPVFPTDLDRAARVLMSLGEARWADEMQAMIEDADFADRFRRSTGKALDGKGGGGLGEAALLRPHTDTISHCHAQYCAALAAVLEGLNVWRVSRQALA